MASFFSITSTLLLLIAILADGQTLPASQVGPAQDQASRIEAAIQRNDPRTVLAESLALLHSASYDQLVDRVINQALQSLQLTAPADAMALYAEREPIILSDLNPTKREQTRTPGQVPVRVLYADGIAYAALQQFYGESAAAATTTSALNSAINPFPGGLTSEDALAVTAARSQYALLGRPLPRIALTLSLYSATETPRINKNYGSSTVLLLFPDWCAECVRMGQALLPTLYRMSEKDVHLYGLLAQAPPPVDAKTSVDGIEGQSPGKTAADQLRGTPTLLVPPETLQQFAAREFPLLIATDSRGVVRFIQPAPENALQPGGLLEQVTDAIARQWPKSGLGVQPSPGASPHL